MILTVCKCLGRGHYYAFTCMYAKRIEILHVTNSDAIVVFVPYDLIFNFFPTFQRFLHKNLRRIGKSFESKNPQLFDI